MFIHKLVAVMEISPCCDWISPCCDWISPCCDWISPCCDWISPCCDWICFYFKKLSVFSSSGGIPFVTLFVNNNFNAPLMFPFPINFANFFKTSATFFGSLFDVNLCWMVSVSSNKDLIPPLFPTVVFFRGRPNGLSFLTFFLAFLIRTQALCVLLSS